MLRATLRCLGGFLSACLTWAAVQVGFVITPIELVTADAERLAAAGALALLGFVHSAVLAAPFALAGVILAEQRAIRSLTAYLAAAGGLAALIFAVRSFATGTGEVPFVARYVFIATVVPAVAAGLAYWAIAGRYAGRTRARQAEGTGRARTSLIGGKVPQ